MTASLSALAGSSSTGETITLGGGCFWCIEAVFLQVDGVLAVESGYSNGQGPRPSYEDVCTGETGYAEVVRVRFDPARITLQDVLTIFFTVHDPTSLNRQGNDVGTQYRSGVYTHHPEQQAVAREVMAQLQPSFDAPIVTELAAEQHYWPAEAYHQRYFEQHPNQGYCAFVVAPKVAKLRQAFASRFLPQPIPG